MPDITTIRVVLPVPRIFRINVSFARGPAGAPGPAGADGAPGSDTNVIVGHAALRALTTTSTTVETVMHNVFTQVGGAWVSSPWLIIAGTSADDDEYILRPNDYNAMTNAKIWVKTGGA